MSSHFSDLCGEYRTLLLSDSKSNKKFYHNVCYTFLPNGKHIVLLTFIVNKNNKTIFTSDDVDKALEVYNEI